MGKSKKFRKIWFEKNTQPSHLSKGKGGISYIRNERIFFEISFRENHKCNVIINVFRSLPFDTIIVVSGMEYFKETDWLIILSPYKLNHLAH